MPLIAFLLGAATCSATTETLKTNILVIGGSMSGAPAAFAAARTNPDAQVLLVEPDDWMGGQSTVQGVAAIDNTSCAPAAALMRNYKDTYYPKDYRSFLKAIKDKPAEAPGTGMVPNGSTWVSREAFDPRTAAWVLDQMAKDYTNLTVMKMAVVKNVTTKAVSDDHGAGKEIESVTVIKRTAANGYVPYTKALSEELKDRYTATDSTDFTKTVYEISSASTTVPLTVIDASETGDIIVPAGADYTVGRERTTEVIAEDGTPPEYNESASQATVFVHCIAGVNASDPINEDSLKTQWADFDTYYNTQVSSYFGFGSYTWERIWTYRRLRCVGTVSYDAVNVGDVSMQNWYPGNDYPYGSIYLDKTNALTQLQSADGWYGGLDMTHLATAEEHAVAWYFYMKAKKPSDITWQTRYPHNFDDDDNMMSTKNGLSKFPYIRCCRRILGPDNWRLMNRYFVDTQASDYSGTATSYRFYDSVGIGNYAVDIHPQKNTSGLSPTVRRPAPFYVPYRSLASNNIRNLLVGGKQIAGTFLTNAAYRLHPIEWVIGSAAGTAAGLMSTNALNNREMMDIDRIHELQTAVNENSPISWAAFDSQPIPPTNGDFVVNDFATITEEPFQIETYYGNGQVSHVEVYCEDQLIGDTYTYANGRFVLADVTLKKGTGTYTFTAKIYDKSNTLIDTLTATAKVVNTLPPYSDTPIIIDDLDSGFSTTGTWTSSSSQPNCYGGTYRYSWGSATGSTATWHFNDIITGEYAVSTFYPNAYNRSTAAPFIIKDANGETTVYIDQKTYGGEWISLGTYYFTAEEGATITLMNNLTDPAVLVCADAVRIARNIAKIDDWSLHTE